MVSTQDTVGTQPPRTGSPPAALVVGGSAGIGLALARTLLGAGYRLSLTGRSPTRLEQAVTDLAPAVGDIAAIAADAGDESAPAALVSKHLDAWQRLDVLVVNAGTGKVGPLSGMADSDIDRAFAVNAIAPVRLLREALPALRAAGAEHGRALVVFTSSISGARPTPNAAVYSATKAAMLSLARSVNVDHAHEGVRACALCPAYVDTDMTRWVRDEVPREAMLRPEDVGEALAFLLRLSANAFVDEIVIGRVGATPLQP